MKPIPVPVSPGELIDKITILQIKVARLVDADALANVRRELALLQATAGQSLPPGTPLSDLKGELRGVNEALWEVEDALRAHEAQGDFGKAFVSLARSVYRLNDRRSALKRAINERLGSEIVEEKSYGAPVSGPGASA